MLTVIFLRQSVVNNFTGTLDGSGSNHSAKKWCLRSDRYKWCQFAVRFVAVLFLQHKHYQHFACVFADVFCCCECYQSPLRSAPSQWRARTPSSKSSRRVEETVVSETSGQRVVSGRRTTARRQDLSPAEMFVQSSLAPVRLSPFSPGGNPCPLLKAPAKFILSSPAPCLSLSFLHQTMS